MTKSISNLLESHGRAMLLTFEVFWIVVFLLEQMSGQGGGQVPAFVYVNF